MKTYDASNALFSRAHVIPGRSNTRSKAPGKFFDVDRGPLFAAEASGAVVFDVDGNAYVDMLCGLGAISLGYGLIQTPFDRVGSLSLPHEFEVVAAEAILSDVAPWAKYVRVVRTGSESTTAAIMIARRATGRRPIFVADNAYHAWHPWASERWIEDTYSYRYGDRDSLVALCEERGAPAAIVVEPARWEETPDGYLNWMQEFAESRGALFVVDEMIYGGRWNLGGATERYGLKPDLACFGKAFGNGRPVAFVVGGEHLGRYGELVSGTYSGDVASLATVVGVLKFYKEWAVVDRLWDTGRLLREVLSRASKDVSTVVAIEGAEVHQRVRFLADSVGEPLAKEFSALMASRGVLWHPACANVCWSHIADQILLVGDAALYAFSEMKKKGLL